MLSSVLILAVGACLSSTGEAGFPRTQPTQGEPWPTPAHLELRNTSLLLPSPDRLEFRQLGGQCDELSEAVVRYKAVVSEFLRSPNAGRRRAKPAQALDVSAELVRVDVNLKGGCQGKPVPEYGMDESYQLDVRVVEEQGGVATLATESLWGALRGLETLVQMMFVAGDESMLHIREAVVKDYPRFSHRGILLDTARHFLPTTLIKELIDSMAVNKINVFHWHVVDDQSFPFVSVTFPELSKEGAYADSLVYSTEDVEEIIEFARVRGIRVIPEFDTPGHTRSWGVGLANFTTPCYSKNGQPDGNTGPIDPSNEAVYRIMTSFLNEVVDRFPDKYIHLGGDEVSFGFSCWLSNPRIVAWMKSLNLSTAVDVEGVYIRRLLNLVEGLPSEPEYVVWQEVVDSGIEVKSSTIVEVWKPMQWSDTISRITGLGHRVILSSPWYLDRIKYGIDWPEYYDVEPLSFNGTDDQKALVIGGEACLWAEHVDETNVMSRLWTRASAIAERLWSPQSTKRSSYTASRMEEHRCRMLGRGFQAQPANGPGFC